MCQGRRAITRCRTLCDHPNHVSYLDVLVVAAALSWSRLRQAYWAGDAQRFFPHRLGRIFCRAVHLFPVDAMHPGAALDTARRVLVAGDILVWFPEGWRSPDGTLRFAGAPRPGLLPPTKQKAQIDPGLSSPLDEKRGSRPAR
ncbi:MAG: 1-acyl-sn-glycerol-3-phosphate acyltransferase [Stellaceae bacterium]